MNDTTLFTDIVGQEQAKKKLGFYLNSYQHTHIFPNMMFCAAKGQGKTTLARGTARGLILFDEEGKPVKGPDPKDPTKTKIKKKPFVEVNCSTLKNVKQFINGFIIPYVQDKDVTVLFDEASEIPHNIAMALLTILNPNPEARTSFSFEEYTCDFDFRKQTFLFATSEPQDVFHALTDRLTRIDLEDYTFEQIAKIVQKGAPDVKFEDGVLDRVSTVLRGNARAAQKMADDIKVYLCNKKVFNNRGWKELRDVMGILPLGLNNMELGILRIISAHRDGIPLTGLAARTGLTRESIQRDYEMYLMKHGLISISTTGRVLTAKGQEYLKLLAGKTTKGSQLV
jgi:Holliday junction resolvasome RuvABC ATP-dependent DNA helicase subunit